MPSDNDELQAPTIQNPLMLHEDYEPMPTYEDDVIPGPPTKFRSLFEAIREAPTGDPAGEKRGHSQLYVQYSQESLHRPEYSPRSHPRMRYDITMHVECFLVEDNTNSRGYYYNTNQEQMIPRQLFSYIMFKSEGKGKSIQAWIGFLPYKRRPSLLKALRKSRLPPQAVANSLMQTLVSNSPLVAATVSNYYTVPPYFYPYIEKHGVCCRSFFIYTYHGLVPIPGVAKKKK
mmetsp:Transcript_26601/g.58545  ORF Transcript_26601/g.58545 Transcript_26601/m.58545 type:complete len:231 (-) Transcript_26601:36-728(-)